MIKIRFVKGPAFWVGLGFYFSLFAIPITLHVVYGSWVLSIGLTIIWVYLYVIIGSMALPRLLMPIHLWRLLAARSQRTRKANEKNADCLGMGTLNGCDLYFALVLDRTALTIGVCKILFLRPKSITIPWDQIQMDQVGTNGDGEYVAVISFPFIHGCQIVLPWRRKFAKTLDEVQLGSSPAVG